MARQIDYSPLALLDLARMRRLTDQPGAGARAKQRAPEMVTKSSIMVGIGEKDEEVLETMRALRSAGVDVLTLGQYLRPTPKHVPVDRYVEPSTFEDFAREGRSMGFAYVASGPLVRSSYKAAEVFLHSELQRRAR